MNDRLLRVGLLVTAISPAATGTWALAVPRGWYNNFPGAGHAWIRALGPYDEHLVRDVGGLFLALGVMLIWAAVTLAPALVRPALVALLTSAVPHLLYHVTTTGAFSAADNFASLGGLALQVVLPLALLIRTRSVRTRAAPVAPEQTATISTRTGTSAR